MDTLKSGLSALLIRCNLVWINSRTGVMYVCDDYGVLRMVDGAGAAVYHPQPQVY